MSSSVVACSIWVNACGEKSNQWKTFDSGRAYISDPDVALCIRQLLSLAFVPASDVVGAFDELVESPFFRENEEMVLQLVNYFEDNRSGDRQGEVDEVLRCSPMLCGTVSTPFNMIYREQITQLKVGTEDSSNHLKIYTCSED